MSSRNFSGEKEIMATQDRVWQALVDPDLTSQYFFGTRVSSNWESGSKVLYLNPDNSPAAEGEVKEITPLHRLVISFKPSEEAGWDPQPDAPPETITWQLIPTGNSCKVVLNTSGERAEALSESWTQVLSSLKSVLESQ